MFQNRIASQRFYHLLLLFIIAVSGAIRLSGVERSVRIDESTTMRLYASQSPSEFLLDFSDTNNHFFNTLLMHIQYRLLGIDEDWKLRVHVFFIGILVTLATYYLGKELYNPTIGIVASALTSILYMLVEFSINARGYIIITLIYIGLLLLIHRARNRADLRLWGAIGLLTILGFFVSPIFVYTMGCVGLWTLFVIIFENKGEQRRRILVYFFGAMILGAIVTGAFYGATLLSTYSGVDGVETSRVISYTQPITRENYFLSYLPRRLNNLFTDVHQYIPDAITALMVFGAIIGIFAHSRVAQHRVPIILPTILWLIVQIAVQRTFILTRTFVFLMPLYALLIGAGWYFCIRLIFKHEVVSRMIVIVLCGVVVLPIALDIISNNRLHRTAETGAMWDSPELLDYIKTNPEAFTFPVSFWQVYADIMIYYNWRDNLGLDIISITRDNDLQEKLLANSSMKIVTHNGFNLEQFLNQVGADLSEVGIRYTYLSQLTDSYGLYELKIFRPEISVTWDSLDLVETVWFLGNSDIQYRLDDDILHFHIQGDEWSYVRLRGGDYWRNYRISMQVKVNALSPNFEELIIRFRDRDERSFGFSISPEPIIDDANVGFRMDVNGNFLNYFETASAPINVGEWFDVLIDVDESVYTAFINDVEVAQWDASALSQGTIGFLVSPHSDVEVTNIIVD